METLIIIGILGAVGLLVLLGRSTNRARGGGVSDSGASGSSTFFADGGSHAHHHGHGDCGGDCGGGGDGGGGGD